MADIVPYLVLLVIIIAAGVLVFMLVQEKKKREKGTYDVSDPKRSLPSVHDFFDDIKEITNGVIRLEGGRYRLILEVIGSINMGLLSPAEQDQVEAGFRNLIAGLNFPVQFFIQTKPLDLKASIEDVVRKASEIPEEHVQRVEYARNYIDFLQQMMQDQTLLIRRNLVIISYDNVAEGESPEQELRRRAAVVSDLIKRYLQVKVLGTSEVVSLIQTSLNKDKVLNMRVEEAVQRDFDSLYVKGVSLKDVRDFITEETKGH